MDDPPSQEPSPSASNSPRNSPSPPRDPVRDPACDQCRIRKVRCNRQHPKCSNCKKAKVPCGFSNRGKRVNHTKQLVNDVEVLGKRLDRIETAMSRCVETIEKLSPDIAHSKRVPPTELTAEMPLKLANEGGDTASPGSASEFGTTNRHRVVDWGGHERFYGFSSMYSLYAEAKSASERLLNPSAPTTRAGGSPESDSTQVLSETPAISLLTAHDSSFLTKIKEASDLLQKLSTNTQVEITGDGLHPTLPPRAILDNFLEPYLANLNPVLPIFSRATLHAAIDVQYDPQTLLPDPAWVVCFNNIILQTLNIKSGFDSKSRNSTRNTMDEDLFMSFLMNAQRCFDNIEKLLKPRLVNVQALLSLALVALNHFCYAVFEMVFAQACQLAKSIGLHQQEHDSINPDIERRNMFWILFIIDKQLPFIRGQNCHLHTFDCDVPLPEPGPGYPLFDHFLANIRMAYLQEDIYRSLYSAEAGRITESQRQQNVEDILGKLKVWSAAYQHLDVPISPDNSCQKPYFGLELKYALLTSRILVQRRSKEKEAKQQRLDHSRESLSIIRKLCEARSAIGSHIVLERILINHPMLCYFELYINLLHDFKPDCSADVELMGFVVEGLTSQEARRFPNSYGAKLKLATTVCTSIASTIKGAKEMKIAETYPNAKSSDNQVNTFEASPWPPVFFRHSLPGGSTTSRASMDSYTYDMNNTMLDSTDTLPPSSIFLPLSGRKGYSPTESGYLQSRNYTASSRPQAAPSNAFRYSYPNDQINFGVDPFPTSSSSTSLASIQQPRTQAQKSPVLYDASPDPLDLTNFLGGVGGMGSIWDNEEARSFDTGMTDS